MDVSPVVVPSVQDGVSIQRYVTHDLQKILVGRKDRRHAVSVGSRGLLLVGYNQIIPQEVSHYTMCIGRQFPSPGTENALIPKSWRNRYICLLLGSTCVARLCSGLDNKSNCQT